VLANWPFLYTPRLVSVNPIQLCSGGTVPKPHHLKTGAIDYDDVAMLNVSATQELAKRDVALAERVAALEVENARLKAQAHKLAALESALETLKQLIPVSHHKKSTTSQTLALAH
jgi:hypothetical protein